MELSSCCNGALSKTHMLHHIGTISLLEKSLIYKSISYINTEICAHTHFWLNRTDTSSLLILFLIHSNFCVRCLVFGSNDFRMILRKCHMFPKNFQPQLKPSSFSSLCKSIYYVCHFIICSPEDGSSWGWECLEKYGAFLNSFYLKVKWLIWRLEWIKVRIGRHRVSVLFNQTCLKEKMLPIYIYIYIL